MKKRRPAKQIVEAKRRGAEIVEDPDNVKAESSVKWTVRSQSVKNLLYTVVIGATGLWCTCPYSDRGSGTCKHVNAVIQFMDKAWTVLGGVRIALPGRGGCYKASRIIKNGWRKNKRKEQIQRYVCTACRKSFSGTPGFKRRHFDARVITAALHHVASGLSAAAASRNLRHAFGIEVHQSTIQRRVQHYSRLMFLYQCTLKPKTRFIWHCDEIFFTIRGAERYLFAVMDGRTRFILSHEISKCKKGVDPTGLFRAAVEQAGRCPRILVTDGLQEFVKAAKKAFWKNTGDRFVHVREIHIRNQFNHNNVQERLNGEFKDGLKVTRGLKADEPAPVRLMVVHHNFFREHSGIGGKTPAEAAGIAIEGDDKRETFIANAALEFGQARGTRLYPARPRLIGMLLRVERVQGALFLYSRRAYRDGATRRACPYREISASNCKSKGTPIENRVAFHEVISYISYQPRLHENQ